MKKLITVLDAVTATTTSAAQNVAEAKKITLFLTRANHSSGSSAFKVSGSIDGTTYVDLNSMIEDLANTNAQDYTRTASVTLSTNGTKVVGVDLTHFGYEWIKVTVTESVDGTHGCKMLIES